MQSEFLREPSYSVPDFLQQPVMKWLLLAILLVSAMGIRMYHIGTPPLDFSPVRQYQNAHNARAYYFETRDDISAMREKIAEINMKRIEFKLEPRIMETLAVMGYRLLGGEKLWVPRVISSFFWIVGGLFLFLAAEKITGMIAALFSMVFYLFLPYSISASRSFQPDPMMIMFLMVSFYAILHYFEQPSKQRLFAAAGASALAMFIKPYCVFLIFGLLLSLSIKKQGVRKTACDRDIVLFSIISVLPAFVYYINETLKGDAALHAQITFLPHLYLQPFFWKHWLIMIGKVTGYAAFAGALAGLFMSRGLLRAILAGLWIGYFIFGLIFTYHIHTHSYYQMQFIPIVALSLVPPAAFFARKISSALHSRRFVFYSITLLVLGAMCSGFIIHNAPVRDYKEALKPLGSVIGVNPEFYQFLTQTYEKEVGTYRKIGDLVGHGTNNVFLTSDYGRSLTYHGELSGLPWPTSFSFLSRKEMGTPMPDKEEIFNSRYLLIRTHKNALFDAKVSYGDYIQYTPDYFIITDFHEFDLQSDLKKYLYDNFPVLARGDGYLIFDLKKMSE